MVGLGGLEPPTSRLSSARSNQLSYKPLEPHPAGSRFRPRQGGLVIREERETKAADPAQGMRDVRLTGLHLVPSASKGIGPIKIERFH